MFCARHHALACLHEGCGLCQQESAIILCNNVRKWQCTGRGNLPGACANPLASAVGLVKKGIDPIPRVASNARLTDDGGSPGQLVMGFLIKGVILGGVVFALARYELPVQLRNFLYSKPPSTSTLESLCDGVTSCHRQSAILQADFCLVNLSLAALQHAGCC